MLKFLWAVILAAFGMLLAQAMLLGALIGARHAKVLNGELQLGTIAGALIVALLVGAVRTVGKVEKRHIVWATLCAIQAVPGLALTLRFISDRGVNLSQHVTLPTIAIPASDTQTGYVIVGVTFVLIVLQSLFKAPAKKPALTQSPPSAV